LNFSQKILGCLYKHDVLLFEIVRPFCFDTQFTESPPKLTECFVQKKKF